MYIAICDKLWAEDEAKYTFHKNITGEMERNLSKSW